MPHPPFSELVDALFGGGAAGLDHVEDALLVGHETRHFANHLSYHLHPLTQPLPSTEAQSIDRIHTKNLHKTTVFADKTIGQRHSS